MRRSWLGLAAAVAYLSVCGGLAAAAGADTGRRRSTTTRTGDRKPLKYYVLQVLGVTGDVTFETCGDMDLRARQKNYKDEYDKACMDWLKDKRDAQKSKEEFKTPPPKGPKLMKRMDGSFKKEEDARAAADKLQKQWDEALAKKQAEKEGAAKEGAAKEGAAEKKPE